MTTTNLLKSKPYLLWHVKDKQNISEAAALEAVLNYGDFSDVKKILKIIGTQRAGKIFRKQIKQKRNNYRPEIANYFTLYFKKYVS